MQTGPIKNLEKDLTITWHALESDEVLKKLDSTMQEGLSSEEATRRLEVFGENQLDEKPRPSFFQMVIGQINNFIVILLIIAAVISALLGDWVEAAAIMTIVVLNAILGVVQESRAEEALAALKKLAAPEAQVIRDGHRVTVSATKLVPGDIIILESGNFIPADLRLLEAVNLRIEEAALTGESVAVQKHAAGLLDEDIPLGDRKNTAFMGTLVSYGRGRGVVVSTGMKTQLGLIADMLQSVEDEETPLMKRLDDLGKSLGWACLAVCGLVFLVGIFRAGISNIDVALVSTMFMVAVSLAIAAVPEGLPAVVTISLALGMQEMVKRHALIRRLASVETLGSTTVICSDKTGTLTQNEMTVTRMWSDGNLFQVTGSGYASKGDILLDGEKINLKEYPALLDTLWVGTLNNDAELETVQDNGQTMYRMIGDPTEGSILVAAAKAGYQANALNEHYPRKDEIPFDSDRKRMVTMHAIEKPMPEDKTVLSDEQKRTWYAVAVKGAPDVVLNLCSKYETMENTVLPLDDAKRKEILDANDAMTENALRVLGLAYRLEPQKPAREDVAALEKDLIFTGMVGMIDPARTEVMPALKTARGAGIRTIMITGDYPNTAKAIATDIGLMESGYQVLTGNDLNEMSDETLQEEVKKTAVFARVSPEHKMRIVDALRNNDEIVAMTGDGVNDAPAIKRADIGISMGITGTDVAKETADMVLTDDNYASIVSAIEQGRVIYSNIRKFVYYLISCNLAEIAIIFIAMLTEGRSPLTAIQLLWLNLVTDGAPALALGTEKGDPDTMLQSPRPTKESIINKYMRTGILIQTIAITAVTLTAFYIGLYADPAHFEFAETMAFVTLSISELLRAYTARSEYFPLLKIGVFKNKWMNWGVMGSLVLIIAVIYVPFFNKVFNTVPLGWQQWATIIPLFVFPSVAAELTKYFFSPTRKRKGQEVQA
ncbi:MAG: cation-translocating P-type ATPase [Anaerolineaceae bacterium]|nr:cation-translocating P-type ATPase [Anaerolineaceae bacterium]